MAPLGKNKTNIFENLNRMVLEKQNYFELLLFAIKIKTDRWYFNMLTPGQHIFGLFEMLTPGSKLPISYFDILIC